MANRKIGSWARRALLSFMALNVAHGYAEITVGNAGPANNLTFDDNAFADRLFSTNFDQATFGVCNGAPMPTTIGDALLGYNLSTYMSWGAHETMPGDDGDYNTTPGYAIPDQYLEVGFVDNVVVNLPGEDLVIFEYQPANAVRVALDKSSIMFPYSPGSRSVIPDYDLIQGTYTGCSSVAYRVDLSDLGVPEGESVYRIFLTSPLMENGDIAWNNIAYLPLGVPELSGVAALHSEDKVNYAPEVDAGEDVAISLQDDTVTLVGDVVDDGLPTDTLTFSWIQTAGDPASIASPSAQTTSVTFPGAGTYEFELTVDDGPLDSSDSVTVVVTEEDAVAPSTPLNFAAEVLRNRIIALSWDASSDINGVARYHIYRNGELRASTTELSFRDTHLTWGSHYSYTVRAEDPAGNLSVATGVESVTLPATIVVSRIAEAADNAEECETGVVTLNNADLDMVADTDSACTDHQVGLRFSGIAIPERATIARAWLQFYADEVSSEDTDLLIQGVAADAPLAFVATNNNISSRPRTEASVNWSDVPAWDRIGAPHETPDITDVVQELIDRDGWSSGNAMSFVISGSGRRVAESFLIEVMAPRLFIEYFDPNQAPTVNAGADTSITLPIDSVTLTGSVNDDGVSGAPAVLWTKLSGSGTVEFSAATSATTDATFSEADTYVLQLEADDGEFSDTDTVTVVVLAPDTEAPSPPLNLQARTVGAGRVTLDWDASTDNRGVAGYRVYRGGSLLGTVTDLSYPDSGLASETQYTYRVSALDLAGNESLMSAPVDITTLYVPDTVTELDVPIRTATDDAEEISTGRVITASNHLELVYEAVAGSQHVGLRFTNVQIPANAVITWAYLQFQADGSYSTATSLTIRAINEANVAAFQTIDNNISGRDLVGSVAWPDIPAWTADQTYRSADITELVQERVSDAQWLSGNAMGFVITGTGTRRAKPRELGAGVAPVLHIEYYGGDVPNEAPVVDAGEDVTIELSDGPVTLTGSVNDDDMSEVTLSWSRISGPGVTFVPVDEAVTEVTFSAAGTYVLQLEADDGEFTDSDTVTVEVTESDDQAPTTPANLRVDQFGMTAVLLRWSAASDNVGVTAYRIYRNDALLTTVSGVTHTDTGLMPNTTYTYQVEAVDAAENESVLTSSVGILTPSTPDPEDVVTVNVPIGAVNDDAEEAQDGTVFLGSSTLELVYRDSTIGNQQVGLRFGAVSIPANATITRAYLQFEASANGSDAASLNISAINPDNADNVATFTATAHNISSRPTLGAISWNVEGAWTAGQDYPSADISGLVQLLVSHPNWDFGNAMGFVITGAGTRLVKPRESGASVAPILHIEYFGGDVVVNEPPTVELGANLSVTLPNTLELTATVTDDDLSPVVLNWTRVSGPNVSFSAGSAPNRVRVAFASAGTSVLRVEADDGVSEPVSDTITITVSSASGGSGGTDAGGGGGGGGSLDLWLLLALLLAGGIRFGSVRAGRRRLSGGCTH